MALIPAPSIRSPRRWAPRLGAALLAATALAGASLFAQQPTFRADTQVVSVFTTVTDQQNRLVPGLEREDFDVFDNDKLQEVLVFDSQTQPITVVVMLDTSGSMTTAIGLLKRAAEEFI